VDRSIAETVGVAAPTAVVRARAWLAAALETLTRRRRAFLLATASLAVCVGLVLLPGPAGLSHLLLGLGAGALVLLLGRGAAARDGAVERVESLARLVGLAERIEHGIERLKDTQWELSDSSVRYRDLLDNQTDIIRRRDAKGRLTFVNRAFCKVFALSPEAVLGKQFTLPHADGFAIEEHNRSPREPRVACLATAVGPRWFEIADHSVPGAEDEREEMQTIGRDVTEARAAALELKAARDAAEEASAAKSKFLASMSHEIRTPMNGILGMTSLLNDTELTPEQKTYGEAIASSAKTLLALIDEILDFSKVEAGKLDLHLAPFSIEDVTQNVVELLAPRALEKGLELAWLVDPSLPAALVGDELRVRQVLTNLVGNAIKFTDSGYVSVRILPEPAADTAAVEGAESGHRSFSIRIVISDSGIGMSAEAQQSLFQEFTQAGEPRSMRRPGTGLGLAISRRLARAMGGDIEVKSEVGRGSTFTARLRLAAEGCETLVQRWQLRGPPRRVLIALGRPTEARMLLELLARLGVEARLVGRPDGNGCPELDPDFSPNVILTDFAFDAGGAERLLEAARARAAGAEAPRGVVLVGASERQRLKEFRKAGFQAYLVRPVRVRSLLTQIAAPEHSFAQPAAAVATGIGMSVAGRFASGKARVLVAEDNEIGALLATRMLEKAGCEVVRARDGAEAIRSVEDGAEPGGSPVDLVLMDIHMPGMDGLEATRAIKSRGGCCKAVPIVALTANAFAEDRKRCLEAGMDDFLTKPFDRLALEAILDKWLRRANAIPRHGDIDGIVG
jgi:PAS domain S-box-containing protein